MATWLVTCGCGNPTEYNCNTCGEKLCTKCKEAHLQNNDTKHHSIIEYGKKLMPGSLSSPPCNDHNGKECVCWCQTCGKAACMDCVTKSHQDHRFTDLETVLQEKRTSLQKELNNLESNKLKEWQGLLMEAKNVTSDFLDRVNGIDKELDKRAKEFHKRVEEILEIHKKQLNEIKTSILAILHEQEKRVSEGLEKVKHEIKDCEDRLRSSKMESLLKHEGDKSDKKDHILPTISCATRPVFNTGHVDTKSLTEMFGQMYQLISKPSVQSKFKTERGFPSITCTGPGQAWVQMKEERKLQLMDVNGSVKDTINTNFDFYNMVLSPQGDILLTDTSNNCIKLISTNKKVQTLCKLQWKPCGLCCLHSGDIAVTFFEEGRVVIYSMSGKVIKELDKELFRHPYRVAQNKVNNDLYISDPGAHKVLALDKDYRVRYEYTGQGDGGYFIPRGLCTDNTGHVIITDHGNNTVHILDKDGQFLQYLLTREQGLRGPWSIDVDSEGNAWVGDFHGVNVVKYLQ